MSVDAAMPATKTLPIPGQDQAFATAMLRSMALIRAFEAKALFLSQQNPSPAVGSMHLCAGQEAVPMGAMAALRADDRVIATYRGHGWALAAGLSPEELMAEICHREGGVNGGRAGSAYIMAPERRFIGETSIVGAGVPMACGVAMAEAAAGKRRVVIVTIGEGAMSQGSVHEGLVFAAARNLPVILIVENNGWSELTASKEMLRIDRLATRARGYGIPGATIDGTDPIAVRNTVALAAERARAGEGPSLIECLVPRLWGHYNRDIEHYRPKADREQAMERDPITLMTKRLLASKSLSEAQIKTSIADAEREVEEATTRALQGPSPNPASAMAHVSGLVSNAPAEEDLTPAKVMSYIEAVNAALRNALERDPSVVVYGEDVGKAGGIFGAARYLQRDFGEARVFDTPIAESAILGSAVGAAMAGLKPVVEIMWADFLLVALDQIVNQAANIRYITEGRCTVPMVVRTQQGATPGSCAQHSQCLEAMLTQVPGLKVALAATPQDAYDLLTSAIADPDPCVVIEARAFYQTKGEVVRGSTQPVGQARKHRAGKDGAIVTWGAMLPRVLDAAETLAAQGIEVSVLDLRWLVPLDENALVDAVKSSGGRVLVVQEAVRNGGFAAEIAARIQETCGSALTAPVQRLTTPNVRMPASPALQDTLIPNAKTITSALLTLLKM